MYQIQLYDGNCSPICDGVVKFYVDSLEDFEKNWIPLNQRNKEQIKRYFQSKSGEVVTDYYSNDPELNIVQEKNCIIIAEKSYKETDETKMVQNVYGFDSTYHIDEITYFIRYVNIEGELLKLCRYEIRGICLDEGKSRWVGKNKEKYEAIGFEACRHLINKDYLPAYHIFEGSEDDEDGEHVMYLPRYSNATVFGNPFINMSSTECFDSDSTEDYKDVEADLYVWHIVKFFENETKLKNNVRHYRLGKWETQRLLMDFPGEAG